MYQIKLSDLRSLAKFGNATVKLDREYQFKIADIRRDGIYVPHERAMINGHRAEVKEHVSFAKIYPHIKTVKQGRVLIAERREDKLVASFQYERKLNERKEK
ncbi:hypothetical protein [Lactococcus garvieae]|uniref:Uncharacterized protein n=1 Tax=Lactococcus garvieae TaxID=1363 RepID=A0A1I4GHV7_9LACT|nr:hypothetical protein [Lactococcus garvieae]SFL28887.1 hypothetical protein SAMN05216438_10411 [Lactococcus garvieae]